MKVYHSIQEFPGLKRAVATTGTFDGVHIGHRRIIQRLTESARRHGGESVLLTFHPHPRLVLQPETPLSLLNTQDEKIRLLESTGLDHLIIHPFTREFSRITSLEFVRDILVKKIGVKKLVIGYDHHFGRNREGSFEHLREYGPLYGFDVEEIPAQEIHEVAVSSTKIRQALEEGAVHRALEYLGHSYTLTGSVVEGKRLGRTLGFPTANLAIDDPHKLIPAHGVYAVTATVNGTSHAAMCNIGTNPTVGGQERSVEVHIFNFNGDLYGKKLELQLKHRIRDEQKFPSLDALREQLEHDAVSAQDLLGV